MEVVMKLVPWMEGECRPGDFGAVVDTASVLLPKAFFESLQRYNVLSVEQLLAFVRTFPSSVGALLGWDVGAIQTATNRLVSQLEGYVPTEVLHPPPVKPAVHGVTER